MTIWGISLHVAVVGLILGCKEEVIEKNFWCSRVVCTVLQEREEVKKEEKWREKQMKANTCQIVNTKNNQYFYFF